MLIEQDYYATTSFGHASSKSFSCMASWIETVEALVLSKAEIPQSTLKELWAIPRIEIADCIVDWAAVCDVLVWAIKHSPASTSSWLQLISILSAGIDVQQAKISYASM
jgi:hypothetical protein